ncbi:hypothetical protein NC653_012694 [Populus alba x Populus x berolinensis]|uniref:Uncharacterized protein n=1 Tax=Populus alba x Populus x berolinensis TaxID=444605 RepID=A0AAD6QSL5_9ROSI|nr:hypothetical protein NC653_012694 [Populus alba x Populus x berolinensis]
MACQSCSSKSACSVEVPKEEVTTQPETVVVQEVESPAVAPQEVKTEEKEDEDAYAMDQKESNFSSESSYARPVFATPKEEVETGNVKLETSVENKPRFSSGRSYARPVFATPKEEVKTGNVKLETPVENKPWYAAVPSVSAKAEEKPSVSIKKQPVNFYSCCNGG